MEILGALTLYMAVVFYWQQKQGIYSTLFKILAAMCASISITSFTFFFSSL